MVMLRGLASAWGVSWQDAMAKLPPDKDYARYETFIELYDAFKAKHKKVDFVDMIEKARGLGPLPDVKVLIIDEAQDLTDVQLSLVDEWSRGCDYTYLAGDDDQAIYNFLGSSEFGFRDYPADEVKVLKFSHRVPRSIGQYADEIIQQVPDRQEKAVDWLDKHGGVLPVGDLFQLDWKAMEGEDVFVLTRHRRTAKKTGYSLLSMGIPCCIFGEHFIGKSFLRRAIYAWFKLSVGCKASIQDVAQLYKIVGHQKGYAAAIKKRNSNRSLMLYANEVDVNFNQSWAAALDVDTHLAEVVTNLVRQRGPDVLLDMPRIDVTTMHASKGREADRVIILPECNKKVWQVLQEGKSYLESRLSYVAMTRARKMVYLVAPSTRKYMKPLFREV